MKIPTKPPGSGRPRMRTPEVSAYSGIPKSTLEKLRLSGKGPRYIKLTRTVLYDPDEVDRFMEERTQSSTAENPRPDRRSPPKGPHKRRPVAAGAKAKPPRQQKRPRGRPREQRPVVAAE
jgi:predicted DNA-binding transcriptional regulator AlpA